MDVTECYIRLNHLRFHAFHGVLPQERLTGNDYLVSLRIGFDFSSALVSDKVADTLNYAEVYKVVAAEMNVPGNLLEGVAGRIGKKLIESFPKIIDVYLHITKINPPMGADCEGAGVEVHLINDKTGR